MRPAWQGLGIPAAVVLVYFAAGKLGLALAFVHTNASAVWPATGIALATLLVLGSRLWPAIFVGALLVNATTAGSLWTSLGIASGNTLEGLLGAYLVNRFTGGRRAFDHPRTIFTFVLAAALSTAVSATVGVLSLAVGGFAGWADFGSIWLTWWLGDAVGAVIVTPFLVLWSGRGGTPGIRSRGAFALEALLMALSLAAVAFFVFGGLFRSRYPLEFLCLAPLIWAALRFDQRSIASSIVVLSAVAIWGTLRGFGPFARGLPGESLLLLQAFLGMTAILGLTVAAVVAEWRRSEERVRLLNEQLEERVAGRTQELRSSQERTQAILQTAHHAFVAMDSSGRIMEWNPAAETIFGWSAEEARGRLLGETIVPPRYRDAHYRGIQRFLATGEAVVLNKKLEMAALHRDGHEIPVELTISMVRAGGPPIFHAFLDDITDRKVLERMREDLARAMVHDLRSPLTVIRGYLDQLDIRVPPTESDRQLLDMARANTQRMLNLVQAILDVSRLETGSMPVEPRAADLASLVLETFHLQRPLALTKDLLMKSDVSSGCRVLADEGLLRQVLQNLVGNAIKFTPAGGSVRVTADVEASEPPMVRVTIEDTGTGIPPELRGRLFEKFVAGPQVGRGSGLGLAFCRLAIEAHRGRIWVESRPGEGAIVLFTLPVAS